MAGPSATRCWGTRIWIGISRPLPLRSRFSGYFGRTVPVGIEFGTVGVLDEAGIDA